MTLRRLSGTPDEMAELQAVLEAALTCALRVTGLPVGPAEARSTYGDRPDGKLDDDKFVYAIRYRARTVGCIDLVRDFPQPGTAQVGLLLIAEPWQGRGLGSQAFDALENEIRRWRHCDRIRLGVVATNESVVPFWQGRGFRPTGEVKPWCQGAVRSRVVVFEKALAADWHGA